MKYYVMPQNELGQIQVIAETQGTPADMTGVNVIELPKGDYLTVISRGKEFPAHKIASAIAAGQIKIEDVRA